MSVVFVRAALAVCLLCGVGVTDAAAALVIWSQKPGAAGCLSMIGFCERGEDLDGASSVAVSPDGQNAYVAAGESDAVAIFDREPSPTPRPDTASPILSALGLSLILRR
jgi:DNA-binding beta-propeller fold protein YncE